MKEHYGSCYLCHVITINLFSIEMIKLRLQWFLFAKSAYICDDLKSCVWRSKRLANCIYWLLYQKGFFSVGPEFEVACDTYPFDVFDLV